mgnify:CR=1 FL=1
MGLYDGNNETIRKLVNETWVPAQSIREWNIAIAGLTAARDLIDNDADRFQLNELISIGHQNIRELITGAIEDDAEAHYQKVKHTMFNHKD